MPSPTKPVASSPHTGADTSLQNGGHTVLEGSRVASAGRSRTESTDMRFPAHQQVQPMRKSEVERTDVNKAQPTSPEDEMRNKSGEAAHSAYSECKAPPSSPKDELRKKSGETALCGRRK